MIQLECLTLVNKPDLWLRTQEQLHTQAGLEHFRSLAAAPSMAVGHNRLAWESAADVLCFCHQDAELHFDVPHVIPEYFANLPQAGVLGFCGCDRLAPNSMWWVNSPRRGRMMWQNSDMNFGPLTQCFEAGRYYQPVDAVDGYCMFIRREVFEQVGGFDEEIGGWHCYDLDLCVKCLKAGLQNYVIGQPSRHLGTSAEGSWLECLAKFTKKHGAFLQERMR